MNRHEFYDKLKEYNSLQHYGTLGQKWGVRKWQNYDGTFNEAGKERYFGKKTEKNLADTEKIGKRAYGFDRDNNVYAYDDKYQNADGSLTKKGEKLLRKSKEHPERGYHLEGIIDEKFYEKSKMTDSDWDKAIQERKDKEQKRINDIKSNIKITKELAGKEITEQEFKDIIEEADNIDKRDLERNHKEDYNNIADLGIDALNKMDGIRDGGKIGDDDNRMWFMWEDQTDGLPEIATLYYNGYSKDYIKQYIDKMQSMSYDEQKKYIDSYSVSDFIANESLEAKEFVDALFDNQNEQKIGGLFSKKKTGKDYDPEYQNADGTLTPKGKDYFYKNRDNEKKLSKKINLEMRDNLKNQINEENKNTEAENKKIFDDTANEMGYTKATIKYDDRFWGDKPSYEKEYNTNMGKMKEYVHDETNYTKDFNKDEYGTDIPGKITKLSKEDSKKDFKATQNMFKDFKNIDYMIRDQISNDYDVDMNDVKLDGKNISTYYFNNKNGNNENYCEAMYTIETPNGFDVLYVDFTPDGFITNTEFID